MYLVYMLDTQKMPLMPFKNARYIEKIKKNIKYLATLKKIMYIYFIAFHSKTSCVCVWL